VKIDVSFPNKDSSEAVVLYALLVNGLLQLRSPKTKDVGVQPGNIWTPGEGMQDIAEGFAPLDGTIEFRYWAHWSNSGPSRSHKGYLVNSGCAICLNFAN
jgi:hypothetical protein